MARFQIPRRRASQLRVVASRGQGVAGVACVAGAIGWLTSPAWALLAVGVALLLGSLTAGS